jgi:hypothetical protein
MKDEVRMKQDEKHGIKIWEDEMTHVHVFLSKKLSPFLVTSIF